MLWNEHTEPKALKCVIEVDGEYVGYCGINNTTRDIWEISIEILKKWHNKGIGTVAVKAFLDETLKSLAKQFDVEPGKLLSHVLEYSLTWS